MQNSSNDAKQKNQGENNIDWSKGEIKREKSKYFAKEIKLKV